MTKSRDLADNAQNTKPKVVDAKGDLLVGTGSDAADRLAVSDDGDTLVADSAATTGLRWQGNFAAGKNKVINGDFSVNQRNFTSTSTDLLFNFDRFFHRMVGGTCSVSAQTFTPGTAPVVGYEGKNFIRLTSSGQSASTDQLGLEHRIESVRTFANQTVTISFWAKAASGTPNIAIEITQGFGTGGSPSVATNNYFGQVTLSTSWARYSATLTMPSISGKTIGTDNNDNLGIKLWCSAGSNFDARTGTLGIQSNTFDFWGVQLEAGSVATAFQTATGTLQGERAACERYFYRISNGADSASEHIAVGFCTASTVVAHAFRYPVTMRTAPSLAYSNLSHFSVRNSTDGIVTPTAIATFDVTTRSANLQVTVASGLSGGNASRFLNASASATLDLSAEL